MFVQPPSLDPSDPSNGPVETLDLTRYRTPALTDSVVALISIPRAVGLVFLVTALVTLAMFVLISLIFLFSGIGLGWLLVIVYAIVVGVPIGFFCGIVWVIRGALGSLEELILLILNITRQAAGDYADVRTGKKRRPTARELIQQIFSEIFLPTLEDAVSKSFGIIARPVLWLYRKTIAKSIKYMIAGVEPASTAAADKTGDSSASEEAANQSTPGESDYVAHIERFANRSEELVSELGRKLRLLALIPVYCLIVAMIFVALLIPLLVRLFLV